MALTKERMDELHCARPGCDHKGHEGLWMHSACHPDVPLWALYENGELRLECAECHQMVVTVQVAGEL
jgi:hypothetical protein